eukprot:GHVU01176363.1.p1 GENE.GHVU01176363.1~~GHVU01176363.1.p1  ORF type:complete len:128 (-),score=1.92 GHVU01176363.1:76-459(-)
MMIECIQLTVGGRSSMCDWSSSKIGRRGDPWSIQVNSRLQQSTNHGCGVCRCFDNGRYPSEGTFASTHPFLHSLVLSLTPSLPHPSLHLSLTPSLSHSLSADAQPPLADSLLSRVGYQSGQASCPAG